MKTSDLIFVGIKGSVVALNSSTGEQVWATHLNGMGFVNVVVQEDAVLASCAGEMFSLDPLTGVERWHNPLKGFGMGLVTIATVRSPTGGATAVLGEKHRRDEEAAASGAAASAAG